MEADASDFALGGCLSQIDPATRILRPVAFYSRKLIGAEQRYEIYDKEMLAIYECLMQWRVHLSGAKHKTRIYTDHRNLEYFTTTKVLNKRQARWAENLVEFNFVVMYRTGASNTKADLLSRRADYIPKGEEARKPDPPLLRPGQ